jgi:hypothetical protein
MENSCLAVSFCIEIYESGVVFGEGFNLLLPCSWGLEFFLFELHQCSSEILISDRWLAMLTLAVFLCGADYLFSPLSKGAEVPTL